MSVPILKTSKLQTMILIKFKFSESFWMALFIMRWLWLTMRHSGLLCVTLLWVAMAGSGSLRSFLCLELPQKDAL